MPNWNKYKRWEKVRYFAEKQMEKAYFAGGNSSSTCMNCKQHEHLGNSFWSKDNDDGSTVRGCTNCGHEQLTVFTPVGFVPVDGTTNDDEKINKYCDELQKELLDRMQETETQAKEIEHLKTKLKDYQAGVENWKANANSWRDDFHKLTDDCQSCYDKVFNKQQLSNIVGDVWNENKS